MERIVTKPLKVDFHIHSVYSKYKDEYALVKENSIENIDTLVSKLNEFSINMCSITDHDFFSYDLYSKLKTYENKGTLLKVFPGVEFSIGIKSDDKIKQIHVIAIFDDSDEKKIKKIEEILTEQIDNQKINYENNGNDFFTEEKLITILNRINLNTVLIAHQKNSVNSADARSKDLSSLGKARMNEFLTSEVFEALEFKSMKSGLFNNLFALEKNKDYEIVRFITGSDCHEWKAYPNHDSGNVDSDDFSHTYLKCLPTFKGVCMALSDFSRIKLHENLFSKDAKKLENIKLKINSEEITIPLSKGINAIIGDNSIGKSLLMHKMSNFEFIDDTKIKTGYTKYLDDNNIEIMTYFNTDNLYKFDKQGDIRERFQKNDVSENQDFLDSKYPPSPDAEVYKTVIYNLIDNVCDKIENKFSIDTEYKKLKTLVLVDKDVKNKNISTTKLSFNQTKMNGYTKVTNYLKNIQSKIDDPTKFIQSGLQTEDSDYLVKINDSIVKLVEKYTSLEKEEKLIYTIKTAFNNGVDTFNNDIKNYKDVLENLSATYEQDISDSAATISNLIKLKKNLSSKLVDHIEPKEVEVSKLCYGDYKFIRRFKNLAMIDDLYLKTLIKRPLKEKVVICLDTITETELDNYLKEKKDISSLKPLEKFRKALKMCVDSDLEIISTILNKEQDDTSTLSSGLNSRNYFDIISNDKEEGIYIIDQPEDDVSQKAIKDCLLADFKKMADNRQIILITHNPQFVVNLDVDNVICMTKKDDKIEVKYGALEFEDEDKKTNIIEIVADNLDGGVESIKKRWKRYGKEINS